jgi:hypothetical protein
VRCQYTVCCITSCWTIWDEPRVGRGRRRTIQHGGAPRCAHGMSSQQWFAGAQLRWFCVRMGRSGVAAIGGNSGLLMVRILLGRELGLILLGAVRETQAVLWRGEESGESGGLLREALEDWLEMVLSRPATAADCMMDGRLRVREVETLDEGLTHSIESGDRLDGLMGSRLYVSSVRCEVAGEWVWSVL